MKNASEHYNKEFFAYQAPIGEFGAWADAFKFKKFIGENDTVLDFGCGGGYMLKNLHCAKKIGIEVNKSAHETCRQNGIEVHENAKTIADNSCDVIISHHALEHCLNPYGEITALKGKLKIGGKIIFVVPSETFSRKWKPNNVDFHLYTWAPINLGNLFTEAGYQVLECKAFFHKWAPKYRLLARMGGGGYSILPQKFTLIWKGQARKCCA